MTLPRFCYYEKLLSDLGHKSGDSSHSTWGGEGHGQDSLGSGIRAGTQAPAPRGRGQVCAAALPAPRSSFLLFRGRGHVL